MSVQEFVRTINVCPYRRPAQSRRPFRARLLLVLALRAATGPLGRRTVDAGRASARARAKTRACLNVFARGPGGAPRCGPGSVKLYASANPAADGPRTSASDSGGDGRRDRRRSRARRPSKFLNAHWAAEPERYAGPQVHDSKSRLARANNPL